MTKTRSPSKSNATTFRVGGKVFVRMGSTKRAAQVVEDRGPIGVGGRRILRVRYLYPKGELQPTFEIPATDVSGALRTARTKRAKAHA